MSLELECERCSDDLGCAKLDEDSLQTYRKVLKMTGYDCLCRNCVDIYVKYRPSELNKMREK